MRTSLRSRAAYLYLRLFAADSARAFVQSLATVEQILSPAHPFERGARHLRDRPCVVAPPLGLSGVFSVLLDDESRFGLRLPLVSSGCSILPHIELTTTIRSDEKL